ncbi:Tim44 domain-containing protein [Pigmentiphaga kullae]|uniref:Putative lipid-binding transport protein (Tim44 family) n=1 Tax=Pigmentiphaga kullae TaxID=151784 RepID=A0A4Q7NMF3_9BURK|nr:TIM44-like domain-containing protein [Pigmentiphaga kullae]RZS85730.1 putative lipid-binding transport protein (Tim44 family) [Pigmentiphaga kullae]
MSRRFFSRFIPALVIAVSTVAMLGVSHDALAKRLGGGGSMGRQSSNVTQRQATPPARTPQQNQQAAPSAAPAAAGAAAGATAARSGMSRWLGPIAGIAAGLGLAALLSHLGLGAAAAEFIGSLLLIALAVFAVLFIVRRLRGVGQQPALQSAGNSRFQQRNEPPATMARESVAPAAAAPSAAPAASVAAAGPAPTGEWGIPSDFDTANFLSHAKNYFVQLQGVWDRGDVNELRDLVTDDLLAELSQQIGQRQGQNVTEVVLLNAELLGIETVSDGHLASVRFSGMLREAPGTEAFRFEEVWNLFKPNDGGWLLAGVQQIPVQEHNR